MMTTNKLESPNPKYELYHVKDDSVKWHAIVPVLADLPQDEKDRAFTAAIVMASEVSV